MTDLSPELQAELVDLESEARRFAGFYPEGSDGRYTFLIFANKIAAKLPPPPDPDIEEARKLARELAQFDPECDIENAVLRACIGGIKRGRELERSGK